MDDWWHLCWSLKRTCKVESLLTSINSRIFCQFDGQ